MLVLIQSTGCGSIGYLTHLGIGQVSVLLSREELTDERIAQLSEQERQGLEAVRAALAFAEELELEHSGSYRQLIDRDEEDAIRVVVATPADRLAPVTWWFPIVGRVSYRGYFDAERAEAFASELRRQGYDTYVRPALLYSTLGFFDDPIPTGLLRWPPFAIVDTILHELVHGTVFVKGDIAYNEGLATFIAHHATLDFYRTQPELQQRAAASFDDDLRFARMLAELRRDLARLYGSYSGSAELARSKQQIFRRYQNEAFPARGWKTRRYAGFSEAELSNAYVVAHQTYLGELDCFEQELETLGDDLRRFIRAHRERPGRRQPAGTLCASER